MLPITKVIEKCMLPVGKRPVIDYVVQDLLLAGVKHMYFVVGEQSSQVEGYYRSNIQLNDYLKRKGRQDMLELVAPLKGASIHFITQPSTGAYGTSVPVGLCSEYIEDDEMAFVVMGDQFIYRTDGGSNAADLRDMVADKGLSAGLLGAPVPMEEVSKYGIIKKDSSGNFEEIVEKPNAQDAPSNLNNASFYIFDKEIFELARSLPANPTRGEYEITDAINAYVASGKSIAVQEARGQYLDSGTLEGWLHANQVVAGS